MNINTISVTIIGGGTAGWLSAAIIGARHDTGNQNAVKITLIESSNIPTIGVGEGTWPTLKKTLKDIGIDEKDVFQQCQATFKQASKFISWQNDSSDFFYHPFTAPMGAGTIDLAAYMDRAQGFDQQCNFQRYVCESGLAPRMLQEQAFSGRCNYGYHLDAGAFAEVLKQHCIERLNITHVIDDMVKVNTKNDCIDFIELKQLGKHQADLFIDCTGFKSLLLGQALNTPFIDTKKWLFNDSAIAVQLPYLDNAQNIACQTISTAHEAGWIWEIGLQNRKGIGIVYSSDYMEQSCAEALLSDYTSSNISSLNPKIIKYRSGYREQFWKNNCVAVGLSGGFVEPMEATAILLIEISARYIAQNLAVEKSHQSAVSSAFNKLMHKHWSSIIDFLKLHYCLNNKSERYWEDHREKTRIPESLNEKLAIWSHRGPEPEDFDNQNDLFNFASYQYILYGLKQFPEFSCHLNNQQPLADKLLANNERLKQQISAQHLFHREFIEQWLNH